MNPGEDMQAQPPPASDDKIAADRDRWRKDAERLEQQVSSQAAEIERLKATLEAALASPVGQIAEGEEVAKKTITRTDILREWFGGDRYARDYEYLDANYGVQAERVVAYLSTLIVEANFQYDTDKAVASARQMLELGINIQAVGEATDNLVSSIIKSLLDHIDDQAADIKAAVAVGRLAALSAAPASPANGWQAPREAFITCVSGNGDPYVKFQFRTLREAQDFHRSAIESYRRLPSAPTEGDSK